MQAVTATVMLVWLGGVQTSGETRNKRGGNLCFVVHSNQIVYFVLCIYTLRSEKASIYFRENMSATPSQKDCDSLNRFLINSN